MFPSACKSFSILSLAITALLFYFIFLRDPYSPHSLASVVPFLRDADHHPHHPHGRPQSYTEAQFASDAWVYNASRDANNPGLTRAQCESAFPDLYYEIDRAKQLWITDRKHTITPDDIEISWRNDAAFRLLVHDNQLRILQTKHTYEGYRPRTLFVLQQIYRALLGAQAAGETLPDIEFSVVVDDRSLLPHGGPTDTHTIWTFTRNLNDHGEERAWLMPDFNFWAAVPVASSFQDMRWKAHLRDSFIVDKIPKLVWRGVKWTNEFVRGSLLNVTLDQPWADVKEIKHNDLEHSDPLLMEDLCRYMFVAHTEGRSWSGRLKFLFNCDSLPVVHTLEWTTHYYHLLNPSGPQQNHIPVQRDFSDLASQVAYYLEHKDEAQRIADNAAALFRDRYTTLAAETCYWRALMRGWSEAAFTPELYESDAGDRLHGGDFEGKRLRGITFEEFCVGKQLPPAAAEGTDSPASVNDPV